MKTPSPNPHRHRQRWRGLVATFAAIVVVPLVAACGGSGSSVTAGGTGGSVRVAYTGAFTTLDPLPFGARNVFLYGLLYDTAITMNGTTPQPGLIQSWKMAQDNRSLTLMLRPGVTYSDGTRFDASALVWNINWEKDPANSSHGLALWKQATATAVNPTTVRLTFPHPIPSIFGMLAQSPIVKPGAPNSGVGTGPFKVASFQPGTALTVTRNPHYWQSGLPHVNTITLTNYANPATAALALKSGTIDMYFAASPSLVAGLKAAGDTIMNSPARGFYAILANTSNPSLNDARVREALSLAFDRASFVQTGLFGLAQPVSSIWTPASPLYAASRTAGSFDLAHAKSLLQQAGVSRLSVTIDSPTILAQNEFLPVYQQDLAKIGVSLKINQIDPAAWAQEASKGAYPQLLAQGFGGEDYDPATFLGQVSFRPAGNSEHFSSPQYAAMVQTAAAETNPAKRLADYQAIGRYMQQQAFVIPLAGAPIITAYAPKVTGVRPGFSDTPVWGQVGVR